MSEMARIEEKPRTEVHITVKSVKGFCAAGNNQGCKYITRPRGAGCFLPDPQDGARPICGMALNSMYPWLLMFALGGGVPWRFEGTEYENSDPNVDYVACPDPVNAVVYEVRRVVVE